MLADRVRHFKEEESEVEEMCEIMQKLADDAAYEEKIKIAKKLLNKGNGITYKSNLETIKSIYEKSYEVLEEKQLLIQAKK